MATVGFLGSTWPVFYPARERTWIRPGSLATKQGLHFRRNRVPPVGRARSHAVSHRWAGTPFVTATCAQLVVAAHPSRPSASHLRLRLPGSLAVVRWAWRWRRTRNRQGRRTTIRRHRLPPLSLVDAEEPHQDSQNEPVPERQHDTVCIAEARQCWATYTSVPEDVHLPEGWHLNLIGFQWRGRQENPPAAGGPAAGAERGSSLRRELASVGPYVRN